MAESAGRKQRLGSQGCPVVYSRSCSYAIRAMSRLAMIRPDGFVSLNDVCQGSDLPKTFVAKIFGELTQAGMLASAKGPGGGFALVAKADEITLLSIIDAIDGLGLYNQCIVGLDRCDDRQPCSQHDHFKPIRKMILSYLGSTTLDQMSEALLKKIELIGSGDVSR